MSGKSAVLQRVRGKGIPLREVLRHGSTLDCCWIRAILASDLMEFIYHSSLPDPSQMTLSRTVSSVLDLPIVEPQDDIKDRLGKLVIQMERRPAKDPSRLELESDLLDLVGSIYDIGDTDFGVIDDFMAKFRSTRLSRNKPK